VERLHDNELKIDSLLVDGLERSNDTELNVYRLLLDGLGVVLI
jgi:hypothetical protein